MSRKIKLMADYFCYPLWWVESGKYGDINPDDLPLSPDTIKSLIKWSDIYNATFNDNYPPDSRFPSLADELAFESEGIRLWLKVQQELKNQYEIIYYSYLERKVIDVIDPVTVG